MTMRTVLGLCVLALLGGAVTAGIMTASPPTASASSAPEDEWVCCPDGDSPAWVCYVSIRDSNVEGSNICSPGATASSTEISDGEDGGDGVDGRDGGDGDTTIASGDDTHIESQTENETTTCTNVGVVNVQVCEVVDDVEIVRDVTVIGEENDILNKNDVVVLTPVLGPADGFID